MAESTMQDARYCPIAGSAKDAEEQRRSAALPQHSDRRSLWSNLRRSPTTDAGERQISSDFLPEGISSEAVVAIYRQRIKSRIAVGTHLPP